MRPRKEPWYSVAGMIEEEGVGDREREREGLRDRKNEKEKSRREEVKKEEGEMKNRLWQLYI